MPPIRHRTMGRTSWSTWRTKAAKGSGRAGSHMWVVTGFQARSGARATWVGGIEAFSDEFAKGISLGVKSGNEDYAQDVAAWTFQQSLVLRIDNTTHHLVNEVLPKTQYTIDLSLTLIFSSRWWIGGCICTAPPRCRLRRLDTMDTPGS